MVRNVRRQYEPMDEDSVNKIEDILKKFNISVRNDNGEYKSLFQVICELNDICKQQEFEEKLQNMSTIIGGYYHD